MRQLNNTIPDGYETPPFPSLYWLIGAPGVVKPKYLYTINDIWRFTLYWTLIVYEAAHLAVGLYAIAIVWWGGRPYRSGFGMARKLPIANDPGARGGLRTGMANSGISGMWVVPLIYAVIAGVEALFAGSVLGWLIGAMYDAGGFTMSTWIPFVWALVGLLVLIVSSFSIQGGL